MTMKRRIPPLPRLCGGACLCSLLLAAAAAGAEAGGGEHAQVRGAADPGSEYGVTLILGGRRGTLADLARAAPPNLAAGSFAAEVIEADASGLDAAEHVTRPSQHFAVKPDCNYTLLFEVKGANGGYVSGGVRWQAPDAPPGLVDKDEFMTVLRTPEQWTLASVTFTADPAPEAAARFQVLLKAYAGAKAAFRNVRVVEGWYADHKWSFQRPFKTGARTW